MIIDDADVRGEVEAVFRRYETALVANDVATLDALFHNDARTIRYGAAENLYGHEAIAAFRAQRPAVDLPRDLMGTVITTFGRDFAVASTLFTRPSQPGRIGRQMQTWVRVAGEWKIVAAHVSVIAAPSADGGARPT